MTDVNYIIIMITVKSFFLEQDKVLLLMKIDETKELSRFSSKKKWTEVVVVVALKN